MNPGGNCFVGQEQHSNRQRKDKDKLEDIRMGCSQEKSALMPYHRKVPAPIKQVKAGEFVQIL